jgi:hypothetical protein
MGPLAMGTDHEMIYRPGRQYASRTTVWRQPRSGINLASSSSKRPRIRRTSERGLAVLPALLARDSPINSHRFAWRRGRAICSLNPDHPGYFRSIRCREGTKKERLFINLFIPTGEVPLTVRSWNNYQSATCKPVRAFA